MSRVRNRDTDPELRVRKALHKAGYRFRLQRRDLPGKPDIYLPRYKLAIFVHGCFWHGHEGCGRAKLPATRREFWTAKVETNRARDAAAVAALESRGIATLTLWGCELKEGAAIVLRVDQATGRSR